MGERERAGADAAIGMRLTFVQYVGELMRYYSDQF